MKKIVYYIIGAAAMLAAASCAKNVQWDEITPEDGQQGITLKFFNTDLSTKAVDGENQENRIDRIQFFVFPATEETVTEGETTTTEWVVADDAEYIFTGYYEKGTTDDAWDDGTDGKWIYSKTMTTEELNALFPNGATTAKIFAVANYVDQFGSNNDMEEPNTTFPEDAKTWKDIHELEVGPTFFYDDQDPDFLLRWPHVLSTDADDLFFVMTCEADLVLNKTGVTKAECELERLASKVTVNFTYENVVEEKTSGNITWVPQATAGETRVYLSNAIEHTTLGGPLSRDYVADSWGTATKPLGNGTRDIFEYAYNFMNDVPEVDGKKVAHFYTYPINLEEGDDNQPYLKLVLPWYGYKWVGEGTAPATVDPTESGWQMYKQKEVYYKIVLPRETIKDPNYIYEFTVNVNIIGSDKEVKIIGEEYVVKDWLSDEAISSNVATGRYISLDIPKDEYDMYTDEIEISFVSSGTVEAQIIEIYQENYSSAEGVTKDYFMQNDEVTASTTLKSAKRVTDADIEGWVTIPDETSYLKIEHEMDNRMTINNSKNTAFDMAPYVFKVTLHLVEAGDDTSFDRTVTITQYPALYVTSKKSNGYTFVNGYGNADGSVVCYDDRGTSSNNYRLGNISNSAGSLNGTGENDNPNNYIITTSMLSDELKVQIGNGTAATKEATILGDPRKSEVDNLSNLGLTNYYPTNPEGTRATIAPKLLIASSYGVIGGNYFFNQETARKRCAAYQENGYPAGRWRVPTLAEITFMMTLSNMGFIPSLYNLGRNDDEGYWCANGKVSGDANALPYLSNDTQTTAVRCVYDAWYWGEEPYQEGATTWLGFQD